LGANRGGIFGLFQLGNVGWNIGNDGFALSLERSEQRAGLVQSVQDFGLSGIGGNVILNLSNSEDANRTISTLRDFLGLWRELAGVAEAQRLADGLRRSSVFDLLDDGRNFIGNLCALRNRETKERAVLSDHVLDVLLSLVGGNPS